MVRRLPELNGRNSRKRAPSTGRFPPTPTPMHAYKAHVAIQFCAPPTAVPKSPARNRVVLKAIRRPMMSDATPQKLAPRQRPVKTAHVVYRTLVSDTLNSSAMEGNVSATPYVASFSGWYVSCMYIRLGHGQLTWSQKLPPPMVSGLGCDLLPMEELTCRRTNRSHIG